MPQVKDNIISFEADVLSSIENTRLLSESVRDIKPKITKFINEAKESSDNLSQIYGCILEANIETFVGGKSELIDQVKSITGIKGSYILALENRAEPYPENTKLLHPDVYGLYYALNDHYSKDWDGWDIKVNGVKRNGDRANPVIFNFIEIMNSSEAKPHNVPKEFGLEVVGSDYNGEIRQAFFQSVNQNKVKLFSDIDIAFVGGATEPYNNVVLKLKNHFNSFYNFSPDAKGEEISLPKAFDMYDANKRVDYVVAANVMNAYENHGLKDRDKIFAACAKILRQGGSGIYPMEKVTEEGFLNTILNRSLHNHVGQDLVFSFNRKTAVNEFEQHEEIYKIKTSFQYAKATVDNIANFADGDSIAQLLQVYGLSFTNSTQAIRDIALASSTGYCNFYQDVYNKSPSYLATSLMVMHQTREPKFTIESLEGLNKTEDGYRNRINFYDKPFEYQGRK